MDNYSEKSTEDFSEEITWPGWKIVRLLGTGSYGKVYEIQRSEDGEIFRAALKVIRIPKDDEELKKIREDAPDEDSVRSYLESKVKDIKAEYALMAKLRSCPNIVIYDDHKVIEKKDEPGWIVLIKMELLTQFRQYVKEIGLSEALVKKSGIDLCKALEACQAQNIVHRDIKPGNMFINEYDNIKLGDFGIARKMDHTSTMMTRIGTYPYMAPEIYHGMPAGFASDIYSVGMVMYRMLNDNIGPFETTLRTTQSVQEAQNRRFRGDPLPYPRHGSRRLKDIIMRALAFDPAYRFRSAVEMRRALESIPDDGRLLGGGNGWDEDDSSSRRREEEQRRIEEERKRREEEERRRREWEEQQRRLREEQEERDRKTRRLVIGLTGVIVIALIIFLAVAARRIGPSPDPNPPEDSSGEEVYTEAGSPGLLVDSTVLLLGDTTPIRYFDGKNTYAYSDDISYYSEPNTVLIETDANHFRYYITGNSKGKSTVIGSREGKELKKDIYVLDSKTATNSVLCDTEKIVFGVTASGAGAANIQVTVEGKEGKDLEARIYSNVGRDKTGNVWVTATGKWENNVLHATLTNYLSPDKSGEIVVVITEKGDPLKLVGFTRIPVEAP